MAPTVAEIYNKNGKEKKIEKSKPFSFLNYALRQIKLITFLKMVQ